MGASVGYSFTIAGPGSGSVYVPIQIRGVGSIAAFNSSDGSDSFSFVEARAGAGSFYLFDRQCSGASVLGRSTCGSFSYGTDYSVLAGTSIDAYISIFVLAG